jgi:GntR family transcriptional repressor for pyruvate dehydrogenase complex
MVTLKRAPAPLADEIAGALFQDIAGGLYGPGDRLPTEQSLVQQYGVSRAVVREAISRLKSDGLVRSARGSGLFVAPPAERKSFKIAPGTLTDRDEMLAIMELRETVEAAAAALAAERRTPDQLASIRTAHEAFLAADERSEAGVQADVAFHVSIAEATGNPQFVAFVSFLGGSLARVIRQVLGAGRYPAVKRITADEHAPILAAIEARDPAAARAALEAHLAGVRRRLVEGGPPIVPERATKLQPPD